LPKSNDSPKMKKAKILFITGTIFFGIICGLGHLTFELLEEKPTEVVEGLKELSVVFPDREKDMLEVTTGFSLLMGVMLLAYGIINLLLMYKGRELHLPSKAIITANLIFALIGFGIAYQYFFIFPIACMGIATLCFLISLFLYKSA